MGLKEVVKKIRDIDFRQLQEDPSEYKVNDTVPYFDKPDHKARSTEHQPNHKKHRVIFKRGESDS